MQATRGRAALLLLAAARSAAGRQHGGADRAALLLAADCSTGCPPFAKRRILSPILISTRPCGWHRGVNAVNAVNAPHRLLCVYKVNGVAVNAYEDSSHFL